MKEYTILVPLKLVKNQFEAEEVLKGYSVLRQKYNEKFCRPYLLLSGIEVEQYKEGELVITELGERKYTAKYKIRNRMGAIHRSTAYTKEQRLARFKNAFKRNIAK